MFTNEFDFDSTITTVMDETGEYEDVQLTIEDDVVYIRQFSDDDLIPADLITMTPKMFRDLLQAMDLSEGFYQTRYK
jgi:hypothetical protein